MVHYIHHVPGRLRIKCPGLKRNHSKATAVSEFLGDFNGVVRHQVNPVTGSIVINYDALSACPKRILFALQDQYAIAPGAQVQEPAPSNTRLSNGVSNVTGTVGKAIAGMAVEKLVERSATALIGAIL